MQTIDAKMLRKKHTELTSAMNELDREIGGLSSLFEQKKRNRIATDGARQVIEELIKHAESEATQEPPAVP